MMSVEEMGGWRSLLKTTTTGLRGTDFKSTTLSVSPIFLTIFIFSLFFWKKRLNFFQDFLSVHSSVIRVSSDLFFLNLDKLSNLSHLIFILCKETENLVFNSVSIMVMAKKNLLRLCCFSTTLILTVFCFQMLHA